MTSRGARLFSMPCGHEKRLAASYSRMGGSHTTLGDGALDCRVRNGNGYFSPSMATSQKAGFRWKPKRITTSRDLIGSHIEVKSGKIS